MYANAVKHLISGYPLDYDGWMKVHVSSENDPIEWISTNVLRDYDNEVIPDWSPTFKEILTLIEDFDLIFLMPALYLLLLQYYYYNHAVGVLVRPFLLHKSF